MGSVRSRTTSQRRGGIALAAFGLLLGLGIAAPAGAQDGGESYTTSGPTDRDTDGNGIPDDIEQGILGGDLSRCSPVSYTVGESFELEVPGPVDGNSSFVLNQYRMINALPYIGKTLIFYGVDADGNEAAAGCLSTGIEVEGQSQPNPPATSGGTTGSPSASTGSSSGSTGSATAGTPGASGSGTTGGSGTPLANTGFGAALPSLLATALVVAGGLLTITVARRRRTN